MNKNDIKYNNGNGIFDNVGICDKGIELCNDALKELFSGQYLLFVNRVEQIAQLFNNLKSGIQSDMASLAEKIEELKRMNESLEKQTGVPVIKEGAENGNSNN